MLALLVALTLPALAAVEPPVSLTASDGSGLALVEYDVDAVVLGPLAFTELRLVFENPQDRVIEGRFNLVLPDGAAVSRFAMQIDGRLQEAEVVEKQAARRAYEDALHRRQDPALLEQASPNAFSARVFPIPAKGKKVLVVSWSEELAGRPWRLALVGLPQIGIFKARVRGAGGKVLVDETKTRHVPATDLVVAAHGSGTLRAEDVLVATVRPLGASTSAVPLEPTLVLLDTSASRALGEVADRRFVTDLVTRLGARQPSLPLVVVGFDQTTAVLHDGTFASVTLQSRKALGASDLGMALDEALRLARDKKLRRVVVVSDGLVTAGVDGDALIAKVKALAAVGVRRLDAIAVGGLRDTDQLRRLVAGVLPEEGTVIDGSGTGAVVVDNAIAHLSQPAKSGLKVELAGASWVWPKQLDGVQPGDEVLIVAELPASAKPVLKIGGVVVDLGAVQTSTPAPLLRRAWARAKIARLLDARDREKVPAARAELADQIVKVSTQQRVLSPLTAMIVLETEADYARFGIARNALTDILAVDDSGLVLRKRAEIVVVTTPVPAAKPKPDAGRNKAKKMVASEGEAEGNLDDSDDGVTYRSKTVVNFEDAAKDAPGGDDEDRKGAAAPSMEPAPSPSAAPPPPPPRAAPRRVMAESSVSAPTTPSMAPREEERSSRQREEQKPPRVDPYTGPFAEVMKLVAANRLDDALRRARGWREEDKGDMLALLALGEVFEKQKNVVDAGRAYGSLIDLFSDRADIRRLAGARLDRLAAQPSSTSAAVLAEDTWRRAATDRPDHPQGPRGQAWALSRLGRHADAFALIETTMKTIDLSRFSGVDQILKDDLALLGAVWAKASPSSSSTIQQRVKAAGGVWASAPSLRFVLWWETDANDVDFHIHDGKQNHAFYSQKDLASGGRLYADVTTGFGPECFTIEGTPRAFPYTLEAHYYSRGPMGFGMGSMRVVQHDGRGTVLVEDRPFVIMVDGAFVDLGVVAKPLSP